MKKRLLLALAAGLIDEHRGLRADPAHRSERRPGCARSAPRPHLRRPHRLHVAVRQARRHHARPEVQPELATEWSWGDDGKSLTFKLRPGVQVPRRRADERRRREGQYRTGPHAAGLPAQERADLGRQRRGRRRPHREGQSLPPRRDPALAALRPRRHDHVAEGPRLAPISRQKPVCSGPYKFVERVQNDRIMLEKFDDHWDAKNFDFERIVFQPIPDTTVRLANLRSGNLDLIERLAPSDVPRRQGRSNLVFAPVSGIGYQGLTINTNNGERAKSPARPGQARAPGLRAVDRPQRHQRGGRRRHLSARRASPSRRRAPTTIRNSPPTSATSPRRSSC